MTRRKLFGVIGGGLTAVVVSCAVVVAVSSGNGHSDTATAASSASDRPITPRDTNPATPPGSILTADEALVADASHYAAETGVNPSEAKHRLSMQEEMGLVGARIREAFPERYTGSWLTHEDGFGLVVLFTGEADEETAAAFSEIVHKAPAPVELRWGGKHSLAALLTANNALIASEELAHIGPSTGIDQKNGAIVVGLPPSSPWMGRELELGQLLSSRYGVPFDVTTLDYVLSNQPGISQPESNQPGP